MPEPGHRYRLAELPPKARPSRSRCGGPCGTGSFRPSSNSWPACRERGWRRSSVPPYALTFAAGAMIFIVAEQWIPQAQRKGAVDPATVSVTLGFAIMMTLDAASG